MFSVIWCLVFVSWVLLCLMLCFKYEMILLISQANSSKLTLFFSCAILFYEFIPVKGWSGDTLWYSCTGGRCQGAVKGCHA